MIRDGADVIAALGGPRELSNILKLPWRTVYNWTRPERRIPADAWHHIAALKRAKEVGVSFQILASLPANR